MKKNNIKTIGIIGFGHFGKFLMKLSEKYFPDIEVRIFSRTKKIDNKIFYYLDEVSRSDIVFLTVPIKNIGETILKIKNLLSRDAIVVDISTVKEYPENELRKLQGVKYICSHPMFGPFSYHKIGNKLEGLRIVLTSHNLEKEEYEKLKEILINKLRLNFIEMTSQEHDMLLAETLFLTHFIAQVVVKSGYERTQIDTVSFGFLMNAVESVKEDKELFKDVYKYNKYTKNVIKIFKNSLEEINNELMKDE